MRFFLVGGRNYGLTLRRHFSSISKNFRRVEIFGFWSGGKRKERGKRDPAKANGAIHSFNLFLSFRVKYGKL